MYAPVIYGLVMISAAAVLSGCTAVSGLKNAVGLNGIGPEFEVACSASGLRQGAVSHPNIVPFSSNRIVVTFFPSKDLESNVGEMGADWPMYSDDGGMTWRGGDPFIWIDGTPDHTVAVTAGQVVAVKDGHYGYFFGFTVLSNQGRYATEFWVMPNKEGRYIIKAVESDGGNAWRGPFDVEYYTPTNIRPEQLVMPARGFETQDGLLGMVTYGKMGTKYETQYFVSTNKGRSFEYRSTVANMTNAPWGSSGPCEPAMIQLSSGELYCLMRTGSPGYGIAGAEFLEARSKDGGYTWSYRRSLLSGVLPKLIQTQSGDLYALYGRPGNEMSVSRNEGGSWTFVGSFSPADQNTSGYVDGLEVERGRLLVVYDRWQRTRQKFWLWEPPPPVNCIIGRFVDIR
jgi:hypothetical protein